MTDRNHLKRENRQTRHHDFTKVQNGSQHHSPQRDAIIHSPHPIYYPRRKGFQPTSQCNEKTPPMQSNPMDPTRSLNRQNIRITRARHQCPCQRQFPTWTPALPHRRTSFASPRQRTTRGRRVLPVRIHRHVLLQRAQIHVAPPPAPARDFVLLDLPQASTEQALYLFDFLVAAFGAHALLDA